MARASSLPVDYLGVSPVFATPTKTDTQAPWGLDGLRRVKHLTSLPLVAIGGIDLDKLPAVLASGAGSVAVVRAITSAPNPEEAAHTFMRAIASGR